MLLQSLGYFESLQYFWSLRILLVFTTSTNAKDFFLPVHQSIFKKRSDRVDVVLAHLSDVFEQERQRF